MRYQLRHAPGLRAQCSRPPPSEARQPGVDDAGRMSACSARPGRSCSAAIAVSLGAVAVWAALEGGRAWVIALAAAALALWMGTWRVGSSRADGNESGAATAYSPVTWRRSLAATRQLSGATFAHESDPERRKALRDRLILTYAPLVKFVAGRLGATLPVARRRAGSRLLRPARADRRDRALRPRPRDQVRDVRDRAHQGRDHRRAPLARLGAALGAHAGPRDRAGDRRARAPPAPRPDRRGDRRRRSGSRSRSSRTASPTSRARRWRRSTSCGRRRRAATRSR